MGLSLCGERLAAACSEAANRWRSWSRRRHVHRDGDAVRDHVEDGRALLCARDDLPQLLLRRVDLRRGRRRGSARSRCGTRPRGRVRPARPCRLRASTPPRSGGRRGRRRRRRARWSGRRRARAAGTRPGSARVAAEQDCRLAGIDHELVSAGSVLLVRGVEVADRRAVVRAVDPAVPRPELEPRQRGSALIASSVPNSCSVSTPLRIAFAVVLIRSSFLVVPAPCRSVAK